MKRPRLIGLILVATSSLVIVATAAREPLVAASEGSLYTYSFVSATSPIANQALTNPSANLVLSGSWTSDSTGTQFSGNLTNSRSVGYARPTTGPTIDVPATRAVGASVRFVRSAACPVDSQNISQIGSFGTGLGEVKLQLSRCVGGLIYPECRIAGELTPTTAFAVRGTVALVAGSTYRLSCVKGPDNGTSATLSMQTVLIDPVGGNRTTLNNFTIPDTGRVISTRHLSVANKYPLPSQSSNTDQFVGRVVKLSYCAGSTIAAAQNCLDAEVPLSTTSTTTTTSPTSTSTSPTSTSTTTAPTTSSTTPTSISTTTTSTPPTSTTAPAALVDEVKYAFGDTSDTVVFSWRGAERQIWYGRDQSYGSVAVASDSAITPVDIAGPFREVALTSLEPGTTYYYKIGENGQASSFSTAPAAGDDFRAISIGDTIASTCRSYQSAMNQLVLDQDADFMIHGGDISIANECGEPAVHQYYLDIEPFTRRNAFMPVWGNHEYGQPTTHAPPGTPRDTLANYKGRSYIPNAQTVPGNTATQTSHPGCGRESGSTVNTCRGEDWGFFRAGGVLFISYPEPWWNAISDWQTKVTPVMEQAHADPSIDFIVTYGHRPVLSSTSWTPPAGYDTAFRALGDRFSPSARPGGKYVLNIAQHRHNLEVFADYRGVTHVVNGGGGQGLLGFGTILPGSTFRMHHLGFSTLDYDASASSLTFRMVCGPSVSNERSTCTTGSTVFAKTFE